MKKKCKWCGTEFELKSPAQIYCSKDCLRQVRSLENKKYYQDNKDWYKEYHKKYYKEHHPKRHITKKCPVCGEEFEPSKNYQKYCSPKCRRKYHYQRNREKILAQQRQHYKDNRDYIKAYKKKYYQDHKEYYKKYFKEYRERHKQIKNQGTKYPCSQYPPSKAEYIPDNLCLNCNAQSCRFEAELD